MVTLTSEIFLLGPLLRYNIKNFGILRIIGKSFLIIAHKVCLFPATNIPSKRLR